MSQSPKQKRLDSIEVKLTPKEWAIRLADEMRQYSNTEDFNRAMAKKVYFDAPYSRPYLALAQQAKERYPGSKPEDSGEERQLKRKLRMEFHVLKLLLFIVNEAIKTKTEMSSLKVRPLDIQLSTLIGQDAIARTLERASSFVEHYKTTNPAEEEDRGIALAEMSTIVLTAGFPLSSVTGWAGDSAMVVVELLAYKAAVQVVQKKYFDGHPILMRDVESALETAVQAIRDSVSEFNEYLKAKGDLFEDEDPLGWKCFAIDIEGLGKTANEMRVDSIVSQWVTAAKDEGTADILQETGEHRSFLWDRFR